MKLAMKPKRWLVTLHILFAAIMVGNMVTFLILSITAATSASDQLVTSCYQIMHVLAGTSIRASTIGTAITGILLAIWTKWGLFQFYWIIVKQALTLLLIGLNLWGLYIWTLQAVDLSADNPAMNLTTTYLWTGILLQLVSLIFLYVISVFKPWGKRKSLIVKKG
ncbi:hypothetical protein VBD025_07050 [Virgibacillus flavescens]|uniref:hypothetical protein n=1 Tax=Virgibacillus flavescens TaxID=1611422 RepID=UPI003D340298